MRNREGNGGVQPAGAKGLDGRLWFPTQDGVVVVDPAKVRRDPLAPPLVVEQVVAGGTALRPERDSIALAPRPARRADRVHRAHLPRADERPLPLPARSVRRTLGRRGQPPHGLLHEGATGSIHLPRRGERRRRRLVRAGNHAHGASRPEGLGDGSLSLGLGGGVRHAAARRLPIARGAPARPGSAAGTGGGRAHRRRCASESASSRTGTRSCNRSIRRRPASSPTCRTSFARRSRSPSGRWRICARVRRATRRSSAGSTSRSATHAGCSGW